MSRPAPRTGKPALKKPSGSKTSLAPVCEPGGKFQKPGKSKKEENEYFHTNALLVSGLLPFIPANDRESVQKWMKKFYLMNSNERERTTRNDYIWFLLVQLESGAVTLPFVRDPPEGQLGPVTQSIDKKLYQEILEAANKRSENLFAIRPRARIVNPMKPEATTAAPEEDEDMKFCRPSEFHDLQPKPKLGFIAYGSCFSDQLN